MSFSLESNIAYKILETRKATILLGNTLRIFTYITPSLNEIHIRFDNYTLHNIEHSLRVLHYMCEIAGEETLNKLSNLELAMIIDSALLHDVGMIVSDEEVNKIEDTSLFAFHLEKNKGNKKLALQDYIRPIHGKRSYDYIMNDETIKSLLYDERLTTVNYSEDIALICQSHMESIEWIDEHLQEDFSKGDHFNSKYIALLLRIADYIDFDSQRAPKYLLDHKSLNEISQTEWNKHATVCNFEKVDHVKKEIYFDIECRDFHLFCKLMNTIDAMKEEVYNTVHFSKKFKNNTYHLPIKDSIRNTIKTIGFSSTLFTFTLDYYNITNLLMGENLYINKEYGFRELLQNSLDACGVMKEYFQKNDPTANYTPEVNIIYDYDNSKVIIKDNGTGMSNDIIHNYFLTIGKSYYRSDEYLKLGYQTNPTGTFGIGFLSCFMLSNNVCISTKYFETGEESTFYLEKNSKYICHLEDSFTGQHGTAISLSMDEFESVFSKESLVSFIEKNFYDLGAVVKIYNKNSGAITYEKNATATSITSYLDIDLTKYLKGAVCKANITTVIDEFKLYRKFPDDWNDFGHAVLLSRNDIQLIQSEFYQEYKDKRCIILYSLAAFEELLYQAVTNFEDFKLDEHGFADLDELFEYLERYGFDALLPDFNYYKAEEKDRWDEEQIMICVFIDSSIDDASIKTILHKTILRYLIDSSGLTKDYDDNVYIASSRKIVEDFGNTLFMTDPINRGYITTYVCHRGVLLSDAQLSIPIVPALLKDLNLAVNILRSDCIPSVTRSDLTSSQKRELSYAVGKAINKYLIEHFSYDEEISTALQRLYDDEYYADNSFCN